MLTSFTLFEKRKLQHFIKFMDFLLFRTYDEVFCGISFKHIHELHFFRHEQQVFLYSNL